MPRWFRKTEKVTAEAARRITGVSVPFGGITWADPGPSDAEKVREFIIFLEDRRVLYNSLDLEVVDQVERSIHEIREQCTGTLQILTPKAFAVLPIRSIRLAGRQFHDNQNEAFRFFDGPRHGHHSVGDATPDFFTALGFFRAIVGTQVAYLAAHYDIDVEGELAAVLPSFEEGDD